MNLAAKFDVALSSVRCDLDKMTLSECVDSGCPSEEIEEGNNILGELENSYSAFNDDFEFLTMATIERDSDEQPDPTGAPRPTLYENLKDYVTRSPSKKMYAEIDLESAIEISDDSFTDDKYCRDVNSEGSLLEKRESSAKSRRKRRKKSRTKTDTQLGPQLQRGWVEKKLESKKPAVEHNKRRMEKRDTSLSSLSRSPTPLRHYGRNCASGLTVNEKLDVPLTRPHHPQLQYHLPRTEGSSKSPTVRTDLPREEPSHPASMNRSIPQTSSPRISNQNKMQSYSPLQFSMSHYYCDSQSQELPRVCHNQCSSGLRVFPHQTEKYHIFRPIFVDGCNISFEHGKHERYSAIGLEIMYKYFMENYGYDQSNFTIVQRPGGFKSTEDHAILNSLFKRDLLIFTPRRHVGREIVASDDDLFLLTMAKEKGGIVISKDQFRDVYEQTDDPQMKEQIEKRILQFAFKGNEVWFPQDPLGKDGPSLDDFLKF